MDLDQPEAVAAAAFLPRTALVSGRGEPPRTHFWFAAAGGKTRHFHDPILRAKPKSD